MVKYAISLGAAPEDAGDLVHEAMLEYFERYSLELPERVQTVLMARIVKCRFLDRMRKGNRMQELFRSLAENGCSAMQGEPGCGELVRFLDQEVLDRDVYRKAWSIIREMKPAWRDILILHLIFGYTAREEAEILGISQAVCRSRLSRARKDLRSRLTEAKVFDD